MTRWLILAVVVLAGCVNDWAPKGPVVTIGSACSITSWCDAGATCSFGTCRAICSGSASGPIWSCGAEEECQDGVCLPIDVVHPHDRVCGDGYVDAPETCDDHNDEVMDGCPSGPTGTCQPAVCGDGFLYALGGGNEQCDDGNTSDSDGCSQSCQVETHYECNGSPSVCTPICGDYVVLGDETCDRGSTSDPGCQDCQVVSGWTCDPGYPCTTTCSDGILVGDEECDDDNLDDNDGCSSSCTVEGGWECSGQPSVCTELPGGPCVVYVDAVQTGTGHLGGSWADAKADLVDAITTAAGKVGGNSESCDVWLKGGTYRAYRSAVTDSFVLSAKVNLYGGFAGTETALGDRVLGAHETILDGKSASSAARVSHVVTLASDVILDGLTIINGAANGGGVNNAGGGLFGPNATNVTVRNAVLRDNSAGSQAGAIDIHNGSLTLADSVLRNNSAATSDGGAVSAKDATISGCELSNNSAQGFGGALLVSHLLILSDSRFIGNSGSRGGAVNVDCMGFPSAAEATIDRTSFSGNIATSNGGGLQLDCATITADRLLFDGNSAPSGGGLGVANGGPQDVIKNSVFVGNSATNGGAIYIDGTTSPGVLSIVDSTIADNVASAKGPGLYVHYVGPTLWDDVIWDSGATEIEVTTTALPTLTGTVIRGYPSACSTSCNESSTNLGSDPRFLAIAGGTGTWTAVTYDANTNQTTLTNSGAAWTAGALAGRFVQMHTTSPLRRGVLSNTATDIVVRGNLTTLAHVSDAFQLSDYHIAVDSPCHTTTTTNPGTTADFEGFSRSPTPDIGAYQYRP